MKLFTFLLVFVGFILACSATVIDTATDLTTRAESSSLAKCKTSRECVNFFKRCIKGTCRYPGLRVRDDEPDSKTESETVSEIDSQPDSEPADLSAGLEARDETDLETDLESIPESDHGSLEIRGKRCGADKDCKGGQKCCKRFCKWLGCEKAPYKGSSKRDWTPEALEPADEDDDSASLETRGMECNSSEQCHGGKICLRGNCRYMRGRPPLTWHQPRDDADHLDVEGTCQKDADCGDGVCIENVCVEAAMNDNEDPDDDDEMHILEARKTTREVHGSQAKKKCKLDKDCPKGKTCLWEACRAPMKVPHSKRNDENANVDPDTELIDDVADLEIENDSQPVSKSSDADLNSDAYDMDDEEEDDVDGPETKIFARGKRCKNFKDCKPWEACKSKKCERRDCSTRSCPNCKNGKCYRSLKNIARRDEPEDEVPCKSSDDCLGGTCHHGICNFDTSAIEERDTNYPPRCSSNKECEKGKRCWGGVCKFHYIYRNGEKRDAEGITVTERDAEILAAKPPDHCAVDSHCPRNQRCYGGVCKYRPYRPPHKSPSKRDDEDITVVERDVEALAGKYPAYCKSKNDCPPNYRCYGGICKYRPPTKRESEDIAVSEGDLEARAGKYPPRCKSKADCPPNNRCYGGICKYRPPVKRDDGDDNLGDDEREVDE